MKREILFRGKGVKSHFKGWFFGMLEVCQKTNVNTIRFQLEVGHMEIEVHPESVGQLLHRDKNMILFEGDIAALHYSKFVPECPGSDGGEYVGKRIGLVSWVKQVGVCLKGGYVHDEMEDVYYPTPRSHKPLSFCRTEIIGNVFENPELLEITKT